MIGEEWCKWVHAGPFTADARLASWMSDEMRADRDEAARRDDELTRHPAAATAVASPEEKVEGLMVAIDGIAAVSGDETARQRIRPLVLRYGLRIGLDVEAAMEGKRAVRRLRRGPSVESGAQGGDGTGDGRTDEPISGMVQSRERSDVGATLDVTPRTTWHSSGSPAEMAGLCPYPFPYQIWFDGDAVRARTAKGLYRRGH